MYSCPGRGRSCSFPLKGRVLCQLSYGRDQTYPRQKVPAVMPPLKMDFEPCALRKYHASGCARAAGSATGRIRTGDLCFERASCWTAALRSQRIIITNAVPLRGLEPPTYPYALLERDSLTPRGSCYRCCRLVSGSSASNTNVWVPLTCYHRRFCTWGDILRLHSAGALPPELQGHV